MLVVKKHFSHWVETGDNCHIFSRWRLPLNTYLRFVSAGHTALAAANDDDYYFYSFFYHEKYDNVNGDNGDDGK